MPSVITVEPDEVGLTVLGLLGERYPDVPTSALKRLVEEGGLELNGHRTGPGQGLFEGDVLEVEDDDLERIVPAPLAGLGFLWEGPGVLAVDKPSGVAVETERGQDERPLKAALLHRLRSQLGPDVLLPRPRIVHRLDKDTTGVLLVATTRQALQELTRQLEAHEMRKEYLALVLGRVGEDSGVVDLDVVDKHAPSSKRAATAQPARTRWEVAERFSTHTLVRAWPETGRQHQIRQHLASLGHPLAVDADYGGGKSLLLSTLKRRGFRSKGDEERPLLARLSLHAHRLTFTPPGASAPVTVEAPVPDDLEVALKQLRRWDTDRPRRR